jgi:tetratricopeptide (TPR) repeat protein
MGLLDDLFGAKLQNAPLVSAIDAYNAEPTDEKVAALWQLFLKSKVLLATTADGAKAFNKAKGGNIREAAGLPFRTSSSSHGEMMLAVFADNDALAAFDSSGVAAPVVATGDQALLITTIKGFIGLVLNPKSPSSAPLKCWQNTVFVEKVLDATKLRTAAQTFMRSSNYVDAEGALRAAVQAAQKDPGPRHPFAAELQLELGRAMLAQGKKNEAEWIMKQALGIFEGTGSNEMEVGATAEMLGGHYLDTGRPQLAYPMFHRALEVYTSAPGTRADILNRVLIILADLKIADNSLNEAESFLKRASLLLEERRHPDLPGTLNRLSAVMVKQGRAAEASANYLRTLAFCESEKRCNPLDEAIAAHRLGELLASEDKIKEALPHLERAITAYRKAPQTDKDIDAVQTLLNQYKVKDEEQSKAKEEDAKKAPPPAFLNKGRSAKKELPTLSLADIKSAPKASLAKSEGLEAVASDAEKASLTKKSNPEDKAIDEMREYLKDVDADSIRKAKETAALAARYEQPPPERKAPPAAKPLWEPPEAPPADSYGATPSETLVHKPPEADDMGLDELFTASKKKPEPASMPTAGGKVADDDVDMDQLFSASKKLAATAKAAAAADTKKGNQPLPPIGEDAPLADAVQSILSQPSGDRYDKPISERQSQSPSPEPPAPAADPEPAADPTPAAGGGDAFSNAMKEYEAAKQAMKSAEPEEDEAAKAAKMFDEQVDKELSDAFSSLLKNEVVDERYDLPIAERLRRQALAEANNPAPQAVPAAASSDTAASQAAPAATAGATTACGPSDLLKALEERIEKEPDNSELWLKKGTLLIQQKNLDDAISAFDKATLLNPTDVKAWYAKGSSLHLKLKFQEALECFDQVVSLDKNNPRAMMRKAECLIRLGKTEQGLIVYETLNVNQPEFLPGWLAKGKFLSNIQRYEDAISCYDQVLTIDPADEEAHKGKAAAVGKLNGGG